MRNYKIALIPGDGIGPEISKVVKTLLKVVSNKYYFELTFEEVLLGGSAIDQTGDPLPQSTLDICKDSDAILMAAIGNPKYDSLTREKRPETGLLNLRSSLNLFANIRPVKIIPELADSSSLKKEIMKDVDLIVVRELTGGIYFGKPNGRIQTKEGIRAFNTMSYSDWEIKRIAEVAFEIANMRSKKVCSVDKANVLEVSQLWREIVTQTAGNYIDIELSHQYVDNAAMQIIRNPNQFDVILTGNLFGDILSDAAAMLSGSIGMLPSASLTSDGPGLFEPVHGSAPDIAGTDKANPVAMILSAAMMLKIGLKEHKAAEAIEIAVNKVLKDGFRTIDIMGKGLKLLGCQSIGEKIIEYL